MKNKNLIRFAQSLIFLPMLAFSVPSIPQIVLSKKENIDPKVDIFKAEAVAIDAYFKDNDMPLLGTGMKMVLEADKNNIDWRLLPAIAVRESTGGKNDCIKVKNNPFGWGSCKIGFKTLDVAIETVARNLGGNNPNTEHHYADKTTLEILRKYNPPSVVPRYAEQVMSIMKAIGPEEVTTEAKT